MNPKALERILSFHDFKPGTPRRSELIAEANMCRGEFRKRFWVVFNSQLKVLCKTLAISIIAIAVLMFIGWKAGVYFWNELHSADYLFITRAYYAILLLGFLLAFLLLVPFAFAFYASYSAIRYFPLFYPSWYKDGRKESVRLPKEKNRELYSVVNKVCKKIGVRRPRRICLHRYNMAFGRSFLNIMLNGRFDLYLYPDSLELLNCSEFEALVACIMADTSRGPIRVFRQAVMYRALFRKINCSYSDDSYTSEEEELKKSESFLDDLTVKLNNSLKNRYVNSRYEEIFEVMSCISARVTDCAKLLKVMVLPGYAGTDAYKSYYLKTDWLDDCQNKFYWNSEFSNYYGLRDFWKAYLEKRSEIDNISLDPSEPLLLPYIDIDRDVRSICRLRQVSTNYDWRWPEYISADKICDILIDIPYVKTDWDSTPTISMVDRVSWDKGQKIEAQKDSSESLAEFKESLANMRPSFFKYFLSDGAFTDAITDFRKSIPISPVLPFKELFTWENAFQFAAYREQAKTLECFENDYFHPVPQKDIEFAYLFDGKPMEPSRENLEILESYIAEQRDRLAPLVASFYRSLTAFTREDSIKRVIWAGHMFILYRKNEIDHYFSSRGYPVQEFLEFSREVLCSFLLDSEPWYSRLLISVLKEKPMYFAALKKLVRDAYECKFDISFFWVSRRHLDKVIRYLRDAIYSAADSTRQLLLEDVVYPVLAEADCEDTIR